MRIELNSPRRHRATERKKEKEKEKERKKVFSV
jgi:hypothetical protein